MKTERLLSVDLFRGITMFLLIGEFTHLFEFMIDPFFKGTIIEFIGIQFHHHPWNGLRFWDLIQPFFMFIVGVAIPLSVRNRRAKGATNSKLLKHALGRSGVLLLLGWALYCIGPGKITFQFQNVLAQLAFTYLIAFLIKDQKIWLQLMLSFILILIAEFLYRGFWIEGFNQPFTPDKNFGAWFDLLISGELSGGHWVSFNAIPTAAHTIWGVIVGKLLISNSPKKKKLLYMIIAGASAVLVGYLLDPITPIIKRISTSSFVIVSGGWTILAMALAYWIVDIKGFRKWTLTFAVVGMNPLFIYLFAHVGGADLVYSLFKPFSYFLMSWTDEVFGQLFTSALTWASLWYICYWLYKKKLFFKI